MKDRYLKITLTVAIFLIAVFPQNCINCQSAKDSKLTTDGSSTQTSTTEESTSTTIVIPTECPIVDDVSTTVHLAHECNCTLFYKCAHGQKYLTECPDQLYFNPILQVCDYPYNVNCTTTCVTTTSLPTTSTTTPTSTSSSTSTSKPTSTSTATTTSTSTSTSKPTSTSTASTSTSTSTRTPTTTSTSTSTSTSSTTAPPNTKTTTTKKPTKSINLLNRSIDVKCDSSKDKKESKKPTQPTTSKPKTTRNPIDCRLGRCSRQSSEDLRMCIGVCSKTVDEDKIEYLAHKECSKYCVCDNSRPLVLSCPPSLHFNVRKHVCDFPEDAKCDGIITETNRPSKFGIFKSLTKFVFS